MNHEQLIAEAAGMSRWERHRFMVLVAATIVISLVLVGVALALYGSSGASQLDLSRPSYVSVREGVQPNDGLKVFPSSGPIDSDTLRQFHDLYETQAKQVEGVDSFGGDVMSDQALAIGDPMTTPQ